MPPNGHPETCCNARTGDAPDDAPKREVGEWAGEGYCRRAAGEGTDHNGEGRCRYHGGGNNGRPPTHGLYSFKREELEEKFREAYSGQDWADLRAEIAAVRALLSDYLEDLEKVDADSISDVTKLVAELRRLTGDLQEMLHRERLTRDEEQELITRFAQILRRHVPEGQRDDALTELQSAVEGGGRPALQSSQ